MWCDGCPTPAIRATWWIVKIVKTYHWLLLSSGVLSLENSYYFILNIHPQHITTQQTWKPCRVADLERFPSLVPLHPKSPGAPHPGRCFEPLRQNGTRSLPGHFEWHHDLWKFRNISGKNLSFRMWQAILSIFPILVLQDSVRSSNRTLRLQPLWYTLSFFR